MYTLSLYAFFIAAYIHIWSGRTETQCYFPDGSVPSIDIDPYVPCNPTAEGVHSACCAVHDPCSKAGYCFGNAGFLYRGGCTDPTWASEQCCPACRDSAIHSFSNVYHCPWKNGSAPGLWCCGAQEVAAQDDLGCCNNTLFTPGLGAFTGLFTPATQSNVSATNTSTSSVTPKTSNGRPSNPVVCSASANLTNTSIPKPRQQSSEHVAVAFGVGIPLGFIAFGSLLLLFREHKLRLRAESTVGTIDDKRSNEGKRNGRALPELGNHNAPQELGQEPRLPNELNSEEVYEIAAHG